MKFIITLIVFIIGIYFCVDCLFSTSFQKIILKEPKAQKALVQNMAKFLEKSPDLQKKIEENGQIVSQQNELDLSNVARYFGTSPTDIYFKNYLIEKKGANQNNPDHQTKLFIELSDYIHQHPKESVDSLEGALQSIPVDFKAERDVIIPAFIHSSINFIEELKSDDQTKITYLKRFINNTQDPEIKEALESHFPDLLGH